MRKSCERRKKGERIRLVSLTSIDGQRRGYDTRSSRTEGMKVVIGRYLKTRLTGNGFVSLRGSTRIGEAEETLLTSSATDSFFSISVLLPSSLIASKCSLHSIGSEFQH